MVMVGCVGDSGVVVVCGGKKRGKESSGGGGCGRRRGKEEEKGKPREKYKLIGLVGYHRGTTRSKGSRGRGGEGRWYCGVKTDRRWGLIGKIEEIVEEVQSRQERLRE